MSPNSISIYSLYSPHPALPFCFFYFLPFPALPLASATRFLSPDGLRLAAAGSRCQSLDSGFLCWHRGLLCFLAPSWMDSCRGGLGFSPWGEAVVGREPCLAQKIPLNAWLSFLAAESRLFICLFVYGSDKEGIVQRFLFY